MIDFEPNDSQLLIETTELKEGTVTAEGGHSIHIPGNEQTEQFSLKTDMHDRGATSGGGARERPQEGRVIVAAQQKFLPNGQLVPMRSKPDDIVVFGRFSGADLKLDGVNYIVLDERDVLGWRRKRDVTDSRQ